MSPYKVLPPIGSAEQRQVFVIFGGDIYHPIHGNFMHIEKSEVCINVYMYIINNLRNVHDFCVQDILTIFVNLWDKFTN